MLKHVRDGILAAAVAAAVALPCAIRVGAQQSIPPVFDLVEDIRIASDNSTPQTTFTRPGSLTVLADGSFVTGHGSEYLIRVYNPSGTFVRSYGPLLPGQQWSMYRIGSVGDTIWVEDLFSSRFHLNARTGQHVADVHFSPDAPSSPRGGATRVTRRIACLLTGDRKLIREVHHGTRTATSDPLPTDSTLYYLQDSRGFETRLVNIRGEPKKWMIHISPDVFAPGRAPIGLAQPLVGRVEELCAPGGDRFAIVSDASIWGGEPGQFQITELVADRTASTRTLSLPRVPVPPTFADSFAKAHAQSWRDMVASPGSPPSSQPTAAQALAFEQVVRAQLFTQEFFPAITQTRLARDGSLWANYPYEGASWVVLVDGRMTMRVRVPVGIQVLEISSDYVWALKYDERDTIVVRYRLVRRS